MNETDKIDGIYERNDNKLRLLEGLEEEKGLYKLKGVKTPSKTNTIIIENNIKYNVEFENGQKTGFFLDQKYNRKAIQRIAKDKTVLDCFTHTGSFGLNASVGGAKKVTSLDISKSAIEMAKENAKLNNITNIEYKVEDAFDFLTNLKSNTYDFIILDPPAFTKSRDKINNAYNGYKQINYLAMKSLPRGGYLATCSCSHFMENSNFKKMLMEAAKEANVELKQIEERQQACDHPILLNVEETNYLKFYIFQIQ
jgi:23S rRNA (cytosine1962-C5)-methyltransferase